MIFSSKFMSRMLAVDPAFGALMGDGTFSLFTILFLNFVPPSADPFVGFSGRGSSILESILAKSPTFRFRPVQENSIIPQKRCVEDINLAELVKNQMPKIKGLDEQRTLFQEKRTYEARTLFAQPDKNQSG